MTNFTWTWFSPLAIDLRPSFSTPLQTWWCGFSSLATRSQISSIIWMTSLLRAVLSLCSALRTWLLLWKSVNGLVYHCILASAWAPLQCSLSWLLLQSAFSVWDLQYQVDVCMVRCVPLIFRIHCLGARCLRSIWGWRFQVTLFSGPSILQAPGETFSLG